jgi:hypothetical protein
MITLTEQETQALLNDLSKLPYGQVVGIISFITVKIQQGKQAEAALAAK